MVGPFPPPLHGMASVNFAMQNFLSSRGQKSLIFNLSAFSLRRVWYVKMVRFFLVLNRLAKFFYVIATNSNISVYVSASAGKGQAYEIFFILFSRIFGHKLFIHHHSFLYLSRSPVPLVSRLLFWVAGISCCHITLCQAMALRIREFYPEASNVRVLSNSSLIPLGPPREPRNCNEIITLGFLGNIEVDKGIQEFLEVLTILEQQEILFKAVIAGPFFDEKTKKIVFERVSQLSNVNYIGPVYGADKLSFWGKVDVLLYPTRNDAEPLTVLEALSFGIPVLTRDKGCLAEMVDDSSGAVFVEDDGYVYEAVSKIVLWNSTPNIYEKASAGALLRYQSLRSQSQASLEKLYIELTN